MRLVDVTEKTENIFFRCLHDEIPENPQVISIRKQWYERNKEKGLRAKLLILDNGPPQRRIPLEPEDVTVAEVLKQAGYATGITGKWGIGEPETRFWLEGDTVRAEVIYDLSVDQDKVAAPKHLAGRAVFYVSEISGGIWKIYRWEDSKADFPDSSSWGELKAVFASG